MLFLTINKECFTHTTLAMLALLGLLLSGAEPSSHDFLTGKVNPTLDGDNARAFATHVVHHHANDSNNTMHNYDAWPRARSPLLHQAARGPHAATARRSHLHGFCGPGLAQLSARPHHLLVLRGNRRRLAVWARHGRTHDDPGHREPDPLPCCSLVRPLVQTLRSLVSLVSPAAPATSCCQGAVGCCFSHYQQRVFHPHTTLAMLALLGLLLSGAEPSSHTLSHPHPCTTGRLLVLPSSATLSKKGTSPVAL